MADIRPIFLRPIEHISDDSGIDFSIGTGDYTIPTGVYANVVALMRALADATAKISNIRMSSTLDGHIEIYVVVSDPIVWVNTDLRDAMGFAGAETALTASTWVATDNRSPYIWLSAYQFADQGRFVPGDRFFGNTGLTGALSGISSGNVCYTREMDFNCELASALGEEFATTTAGVSGCLDEFVNGAMCAAPTVASHPCTKGAWFYPNYNDLADDTTATGNEWTTSGGIRFSLASGADKYVFINFHKKGLDDWGKKPFFDRSRLMYNVTLSFNTAPAGEFLSVYPPS
jgi:hypothetical protein